MNNRTILLIEDTYSNQLLYQSFIEQLGYRCTIFNSAEQFLAFLNTAPPLPKLIFLDIGLPGLSGTECIELIQRCHPTYNACPIVALTAHVMLEEIRHFMNMGFYEVLQKPVPLNSLKHLIHSI